MENINFGYNEQTPLYFIPANSVHIPELNYNEGEGIKGVVGEDESTFLNDPLFISNPNTVIHSTYVESAEEAEFEVVSSEGNCEFIPGTGKEVCEPIELTPAPDCEEPEYFECFNAEVGAHRCSMQCKDCHDHEHDEEEELETAEGFDKDFLFEVESNEMQELRKRAYEKGLRCGRITSFSKIEINRLRQVHTVDGTRYEEAGDMPRMEP